MELQRVAPKCQEMLREKGDWNAGNERKYAVFQNHESRTLHTLRNEKCIPSEQ